ncbi:MAG: HigA family addiction module antitoxin [Gammaproteobacteria bacterium]|nr:HigA family addiction module antitoxin [Gammaproteobacteria bacterium]
MKTLTENNRGALPPIHPGEILNQEFLRPLGVSQYRLAQAIGVDARRINSIIHGKRSISAETALLFSRFFGNSAEFWMGLQNQYDLEKEQDRLSERLDHIPDCRCRSTAATSADTC